MAVILVKCALCGSSQVVKFGVNCQEKQRYQCRNTQCTKNTFILNYKNKAYLPETAGRIIDMTLNGSGIRDISRVLGISVNTVLSELKKREITTKHKLFSTGVKGAHR
jgi:transposase-like protein